jgi:Predicted periplasmic ligand-binding sensor domain
MRLLSIVLVFLTLSGYNYAQTEDFDLELNSNIVKDILQQDSGLIWVGTDEGLNVFYDDEKQVFYSNIQDSLSVLNSDIDKIKIDSKNNLIILTRDGISIFNSNTFNFKQLKLASKPTSVQEDQNSGELWVSTGKLRLLFN